VAPLRITGISRLLEVLKSDTSAIFTAAGKAQQAVDWMHAQQPKPPAPEQRSTIRTRREAEEG
jgi:antirestriction protein ArdC